MATDQLLIDAFKATLTVGDEIVMTAPFVSEDNDGEEVTVEAGTVCKVIGINTHDGPQGFAVDVIAPNGAVATFDEADPEPRFPFVDALEV